MTSSTIPVQSRAPSGTHPTSYNAEFHHLTAHMQISRFSLSVWEEHKFKPHGNPLLVLTLCDLPFSCLLQQQPAQILSYSAISVAVKGPSNLHTPGREHQSQVYVWFGMCVCVCHHFLLSSITYSSWNKHKQDFAISVLVSVYFCPRCEVFTFGCVSFLSSFLSSFLHVKPEYMQPLLLECVLSQKWA